MPAVALSIDNSRKASRNQMANPYVRTRIGAVRGTGVARRAGSRLVYGRPNLYSPGQLLSGSLRSARILAHLAPIRELRLRSPLVRRLRSSATASVIAGRSGASLADAWPRLGARFGRLARPAGQWWFGGQAACGAIWTMRSASRAAEIRSSRGMVGM